jgi:tetratricopeptide (TPR) repeat protein
MQMKGIISKVFAKPGFRILGFLLFIFLSVPGFTQSPEIIADSANRVYQQGHYAEAITLYDSVISMGFESAPLYYNLANAHFKDDNLAEAILYYEKAKKLAPNDEDILHNLTLANQLTIDKIEAVPELFYKKWWKTLSNMLSVDGWAIFFLVTFFLTLLLAAFFFMSRKVAIKKIAFYAGVIALLFSVLSLVLTIEKYQDYHNRQEAIVFVPSLTVKSTPDKKGIDLFVIHEGTRVTIRDAVGEWYEIKIANGSIGWIRKDAIRRI